MTALTTSLLFSSLAAGADLVGGAVVTTRKRWDARFLHGALALGSGFMLAATLPTSLANHDRGLPFWILAGYLFVHVIQRTGAAHTHGDDHGHAHDPVAPRGRALFPSEVGLAAFVGLLLHTFFDGVAIGAGFQVTRSLGLLIFMAVILHKVPEGLTLASIILSSGGRRSQAIAAVVMIGLGTGRWGDVVRRRLGPGPGSQAGHGEPRTPAAARRRDPLWSHREPAPRRRPPMIRARPDDPS